MRYLLPLLLLGCSGTVKVAAVQFRSEFGAPDKNRDRLEAYVREAAANGAKIVVLPETAIPGYASWDLKRTWDPVSLRTAAETVPGESTRRFGALAKELGVYVTVPLIEAHEGRFYNTIALVGPDGGIAAHYRKLNPWPRIEKGWATAGDRGIQTVETPYGRVGLLVCFDIHFEPPRLRDAGVDILLYCIAWVDAKDSPWFDELLPQVAADHDFAIVGANWTVPTVPSWSGYGRSRIIDRLGRIVVKARSDLAEEILYAELR